MPAIPQVISGSGATSPMHNILSPTMAFSLEDLYAKYEIGDVIGTGAFSEVKRATERQTGNRFAVKIIDKAKCRGKEAMIQSEVAILKRVKHRNIIRLFEMYESPQKIFLIMEMVTGGELFDRIVERGHYTEADAAALVYEILLGVQYLHKLNICHRDLKPENLLFFDKSPNARIMISDFGLSKIFDDVQLMRTACGTPGYVAPEVLRREGYRKEVDMWSIGVITYILLCGYPPFYEENNHKLFNAIMSGQYEFDSPYWDDISFEAKNFVARLLIVDPNLRMGAEEALAHPFLTHNCPQALAVARGISQMNIADKLTKRPSEQNNLAPVLHSNLRSYSQRRSSDKITAKAAATRSIPALHQSTGSTPQEDESMSDLQMNPLRPKGEHREVEDSGTVTSRPDVNVNGYKSSPQAAPLTAPAPAYIPGGHTRMVPQTVEYPKPVVYAPAAVKTRNVRLLSHSIFMRVPGLKNNHSDFKNLRLNYFIENVLPQYDIVCLQEMYSYGSSRVSRLLQLAKSAGFQYSLTSPSKGLLNGCTDGGLVILSRSEIVKVGRLSFKRAVYNCRFVAKGALYARVKLTKDCNLHVFTANLQRSAGQDLSMNSPEVLVRQTQLAQLRAFIKAQTADRRPTEPILIVGDFNLNSLPVNGIGSTEEYKQMMKVLRGEFSTLDNTRAFEEFLMSDKDREPLPIMDLLVEKYGRHPVTYGDVAPDGTPAESSLTDRSDLGCRHSIDYCLWSPPLVKGGIDLDPQNRIKVNPFDVGRQFGQDFSHLSDHYGLEVMLKASV